MINYSGAQLANALHALDVDFVLSEKDKTGPLKDEPLHLIVALAESDEARLRLSLVPLFLRHPEYSGYVREAEKIASTDAQLTLKCYYTAAMWLQQKYKERLTALIGEKPFLPDLFSKELMIAVKQDPDKNLQSLANRHRELSKKHLNWLGTYNHGAERFVVHLERQKAWRS
jgi:hypothetical protein